MKQSDRNNARGFTMIELLVVIAIIGLLAALGSAGYLAARKMFVQLTAKNRLDNVVQALELYKQAYGEYPPDSCASDSVIKRHILKRWPKVLKDGNVADCIAFFRTSCANPAELDESLPGRAVLFWLGGPDQQGFFKVDGDPFGLKLAGPARENAARETPMIELAYNENYNEFGFIFKEQVMAYFRADDGCYHGKDLHVDGQGIAAPYMNNGAWINPDGYQLILPGEDLNYGDTDPFGDENHEEHGHEHHDHDHDDDCDYIPRDLADPSSLTPHDNDNITNFSEGTSLQSMIDQVR